MRSRNCGRIDSAVTAASALFLKSVDDAVAAAIESAAAVESAAAAEAAAVGVGAEEVRSEWATDNSSKDGVGGGEAAMRTASRFGICVELAAKACAGAAVGAEGEGAGGEEGFVEAGELVGEGGTGAEDFCVR